MKCAAYERLELALRAVMVEVNLRNNDRRDYLVRRDCEWDSDLMACLEQAVVEAALRSTEARAVL
jgi:hypothetical protein